MYYIKGHYQQESGILGDLKTLAVERIGKKLFKADTGEELTITRRVESWGEFEKITGEGVWVFLPNGGEVERVGATVGAIGFHSGPDIKLLNNSECLSLHGEYGVHDGFFNSVAMIGDQAFYFQCCMDESTVFDEPSEDWNFKGFDFDASGYDEAICREINEPLANEIGWENFRALLEIAANNFYFFTK